MFRNFIPNFVILISQAKDYVPSLSIKDDLDDDIIEDSKNSLHNKVKKEEYGNGEVDDNDFKPNDFESMVVM